MSFDDRRFSLIKNHLVEFNQLAMANSEGSDHMLNRVMPKDNIGLAALLKTKEAAWENGEFFLSKLYASKDLFFYFYCKRVFVWHIDGENYDFTLSDKIFR